MSRQEWSEDDWRVAREMRTNGRNSVEIGKAIGRASGAVRNKFLWFDHPEKRADKLEAAKQRRRERRKLRVRATALLPKLETAMLKAIKSGQEKSVIGVFKDSRPLNPTRFSRGMTGSGCGSSALACAEATDGMPF